MDDSIVPMMNCEWYGSSKARLIGWGQRSMSAAWLISLLMGRNVVSNAARLNGICLHAHQLIGLEWSVGVATQGFLPQDIGVVCQERRIQQPASVRE